jgi:hypothetical protein
MLVKIDDFFPTNQAEASKDADEAGSSDGSEEDFFYISVFHEKTLKKKSHSVGHEPEVDDFEFEKFKKISSITQKRKSEHEIPYDDIKTLEELMIGVKENKNSEDTNSRDEIKENDKLSSEGHSKQVSETDGNDKLAVV